MFLHLLRVIMGTGIIFARLFFVYIHYFNIFIPQSSLFHLSFIPEKMKPLIYMVHINKE